MARRNLDAQLAAFARNARGTLPYSQFAKKLGLSHMTVRRLERGEHHITLAKLETSLERLKVKLRDIFPDGC